MNGQPLGVSVNLLDDYVPEETSSRQHGYVYVLWHTRHDGKKIPYIGETGTTLDERKASHIYQARSRARQGLSFNPAGLYFAVIKDDCPESNFSIEMLREIHGSVDERKLAESDVLAEFKADPKWPTLYNLAANGGYHSGGAGNKQSCILVIESEEFIYTSQQALFRDVADVLGLKVKSFSFAARQRIKLGYTWAEALRLAPRVDGRKTPSSLNRRQMIVSLGVKEAGLKSKEVRDLLRAQPTKNPIVDQFSDRSSPAWEQLTAAARQRQVAASTRHWRLDEIRRGVVPATTVAEVIAHCVASRRDRRTKYTVALPDGSQHTFGVNEWVAHMERVPAKEKAEELSRSGLKRRLRSLANAEPPTNDQLLWALGFVKKAPTRVRLADLDLKLVRRQRFDGGPRAKGGDKTPSTNG